MTRRAPPDGAQEVSMNQASALAPLVLRDADEQPRRLGTLWDAAPCVVVFLRHFG